MGKLRRGALWALFPPAGLFASLRAGSRKDTRRIVDAIERSSRGEEDPKALAEWALRQGKSR